MKTAVKRTVSILLVLTMIICLCSCTAKDDAASSTDASSTDAETERVTYDVEADDVAKAETVYVNMNGTGEVSSITVSDWLHADASEIYVNDMSDLTDIVNVKGNETPLIDGNSVRWDMSSTDLYYRGYSDKQLPVSFNVSYTLDGKEVSYEDLAGAYGTLKMDFKLTNNSSKTVKIAGSDTTIYEPIVVIGGMILDESTDTGIVIQNGKTIGDGSKEIAVFVSVPGLSDSLGFTDEDLTKLRTSVLSGIDLSGNFSIQMEAQDFSLGNMYFVAIPISSLEGSLQLDETLSEVEGLVTSIKEIADTVYSMGAEDLIENLMTNSDKISEFAEAFSDARQVYNDNKVLIDTFRSYLTDENIESIKTLAGDVEALNLQKYAEMLSDEEVQEVLTNVAGTDFSQYQSLISNPLFKTFFKDLSSLGSDLETIQPLLESATADSDKFTKLLTDFEALMPTINSLSDALSTDEAQTALAKLPDSMQKLQSIMTLISNNRELIETLSSALSEENIENLTDALEGSGDIDINELMSSITKLTGNPDATVERLEAIYEYASENHIYSMAPDGMDTSVMYIYRSDSIA